jgi:hypothetical protein
VVGALVAVSVLLAAAVSALMVAGLADRRESGVPLGVFRIAYGIVLFCEVAQMLYDAPLLEDPVPFFAPGEIRLTYILIAWLAALVLLMLGLFTRTAAIVSYVAGLCTTSIFTTFEYHVDYIITGTNLLMAIAPVGQRLSLDRLRARRRAAAAGRPEWPLEVSALYRLLFVFVGIAFVYFDSVFWKLGSPMWMSGLGVWLPASLPQAVWYDYAPILDHEWLAKGLGYLTLAFEAVFIFVMWFAAAAIPLAIVGLGLHFGITAVFPIPWFGLLVAAIYLLVVPPWLYERIAARLRPRAPRDPAREIAPPPPWVPLARPARLGLGALIAVLVACQIAATVQAPVVRRWLARHVGPSAASSLAESGTILTRAFARPFFGITPHTVFLDFHFDGYNHVVAVVYDEPGGAEVWLPIIRPDGQVHWMTSGRLWVFWTFRAMAPSVNMSRLTDGVKRMTAFWMGKRGMLPLDARFRILVKRVDVPTQWEAGFLDRQKTRPWSDAGSVTWHNGEFHADIKDIENL